MGHCERCAGDTPSPIMMKLREERFEITLCLECTSLITAASKHQLVVFDSLVDLGVSSRGAALLSRDRFRAYAS